MKQRLRVSAPIRYGRLSVRRGRTYTMVYSGERVRGDVGTGAGIAVPHRGKLRDSDALEDAAAELWRAEAECASLPPGVVSGPWGSVALLPNPGGSLPGPLLRAWSNMTSRSPSYGGIPRAPGERSVLDERSGLALIPWPVVYGSNEAAPFDCLLMLIKHAHLSAGAYPSVDRIVGAWMAQPRAVEYYAQNRASQIETEDDERISDLLGTAGVYGGP